jgi:hypothetical protein
LSAKFADSRQKKKKNGEKIIKGVSKSALQNRKLIKIYSEGMYSVLNCRNVAQRTDFTSDSYGSM